MKSWPLQLPPEADVIGGLHVPIQPAGLRSSMLLVNLHGYGIDVSWYPERDPSGQYFVNVYDGYWENSVKVLRSRDPLDVAEFVEEWARLLSEGVIQTSAASDDEDALSADDCVAGMAGRFELVAA